ncbi:helix-turn-helix domain-containing protein [Lachnospiraceae bacterium 62-35]
MIKYYKLFDMLNRKGMKKTDLLEIISSPTLAKLSKGEIIKTDIVDKICQFLECQPGDIMEVIPEENSKNFIDDKVVKEMYNRYETYHNEITKEEFEVLLKKYTKIKNGEGKINQTKLTEEIKKLFEIKYTNNTK